MRVRTILVATFATACLTGGCKTDSGEKAPSAGIVDPSEEVAPKTLAPDGQAAPEGESEPQAAEGCQTPQCEESCQEYSGEQLNACAEAWEKGCFSDQPPRDFDCEAHTSRDEKEAPAAAEEQGPADEVEADSKRMRRGTDDSIEAKSVPLGDP